MTATVLKNRINELCTHITFEYNGKNCGVDPLAPTSFDMWCGDEYITVDNIDKVMNTTFFDGNALKDIVEEIELVDI